MVSTPEVFTDNGPMPSVQSIPIKQLSARKQIHQFTETLDVKPTTDLRWLCADKSKRKATIVGSMLWPSIPKQLIPNKINECAK